jgi:DNA modification methylase
MFEKNKIICDNNLKVLKTFPDNCIDSIVTDPPYGLSFMGKKWDYDIPSIEFWSECLRVLKPGGHALVACGTRTQHRMVVNLEDAGFEIRDIIMWVYGQGWPKSLSIGKAVDKLQGNEREVIETNETIPDIRANNYLNSKGKERLKANITKGTSKWEGWGTALKPAIELWTLCRKPLSEKTVAENCLKWGIGGLNIDACRIESKDGVPIFKHRKEKSCNCYGDGKNGSNRTGEKDFSGRFPSNLIHDNSEEVRECFPSPHGAGSKREAGTAKQENTKSIFLKDKGSPGNGIRFGDSGNASRFFKSCPFDDEDIDVLRLFYCAKASQSERNAGLEDLSDNKRFQQGNYSQSPVCSVCSKTFNGTNDHDACGDNTMIYKSKEENKVVKNNHPTVKPVALMQYLVRLITPPKGICLDPFAGSGTTGVACVDEGFDYILIDSEEQYCTIAEKRILHKLKKKKENIF